MVMKKAAIWTLTMNPAIDRTVKVDRVISGPKLRAEEVMTYAGGGGLNVSRALKKMGMDSKAFYLAGGLTGEILRDLLRREGLIAQSFGIKSWTRQNMIAFEESTRKQFRFGMPGPVVKKAEWRAVITGLFSKKKLPDYLILSGSLPRGMPDDFYAPIIRKAKKKNVRLIADTSGEALHHVAAGGVYLIKPNLRELSELTGIPLENEKDQERAARTLIQKGGCEILAVSLGASGVMLATQDRIRRYEAPLVPVKSRVGAGDSMLAGIVLGLACGYPIEKSVWLGIAAGSAAVMTPGTELCRKADVERLFKKIKHKNADRESDRE